MRRPSWPASGSSSCARLVPGIARIGLLIQGADPIDRSFVDETRRAAAQAGLALEIGTVTSVDSLDAVLAGMTRARVGAVIVPANLPVPGPTIAQTALRHGLPTISLFSQFADAGGLISHGASDIDIQRRAAGHVDRILRGARPADLPVEGPTQFELVINAKTGRSLAMRIPASMLLRADRVID